MSVRTHPCNNHKGADLRRYVVDAPVRPPSRHFGGRNVGVSAHNQQTDQLAAQTLAPPKLAAYRYGREEMLALESGINDELSSVPARMLHAEFPELFVGCRQDPVCITEHTRNEVLCLQHGEVNSRRALSNHSHSERQQVLASAFGVALGGTEPMAPFPPPWVPRGRGVPYKGFEQSWDPAHEKRRQDVGCSYSGFTFNPRAQELYDSYDRRDRPRRSINFVSANVETSYFQPGAMFECNREEPYQQVTPNRMTDVGDFLSTQSSNEWKVDEQKGSFDDDGVYHVSTASATCGQNGEQLRSSIRASAELEESRPRPLQSISTTESGGLMEDLSGTSAVGIESRAVADCSTSLTGPLGRGNVEERKALIERLAQMELDASPATKQQQLNIEYVKSMMDESRNSLDYRDQPIAESDDFPFWQQQPNTVRAFPNTFCEPEHEKQSVCLHTGVQPVTHQQRDSLSGHAEPLTISNDSRWFYKDPRGRVQGPFKFDQMVYWCEQGYFQLNLPVIQEGWSEFIALSDLAVILGRIPFAQTAVEPTLPMTSVAEAITSPLTETEYKNVVTDGWSVDSSRHVELKYQMEAENLMEQELEGRKNCEENMQLDRRPRTDLSGVEQGREIDNSVAYEDDGSRHTGLRPWQHMALGGGAQQQRTATKRHRTSWLPLTTERETVIDVNADGESQPMAAKRSPSLLEIQEEERRQIQSELKQQQEMALMQRATALSMDSIATGINPDWANSVSATEKRTKPLPHRQFIAGCNRVVKSDFANKGVSQFELEGRGSLSEWMTKRIHEMKPDFDAAFFVSFLNSVESPQDVRDYAATYFGDNLVTTNFINEFLKRRSEQKRRLLSHAFRDDLSTTAAAVAKKPMNDGGGRRTTTGGKQRANASPSVN